MRTKSQLQRDPAIFPNFVKVIFTFMKSEYTVRISGLTLDTHRFEFSVKDDFFSAIEFGEIRSGNLEVVVDMVKEEAMLILDFAISGSVNIMCDRCSDLYDQNIDGQNQLIVKFGSFLTQNSEDVLVVPRDESEISVASYIYEFTHLLLPQRRVHPEGKCNEEVMKKLEELNKANKFKDGDPRWDALRKVL